MTTNRKRIKVDAILDIESVGMDGFLMAGLYRPKSNRFEAYWWDREEELAYYLLAEFEGDVWAHFGGGYDYKWLLDWAVKFGLQASVVVSGAGVVVIQTATARFADSMRLAPMSLAKFTDGLGVRKQELKLPCFKRLSAVPARSLRYEVTRKLTSPESYEYAKLVLADQRRLKAITAKCGSDCPGFCWFQRDAPTEVLDAIEVYNYYDCTSLAEALRALQSFADDNDLDLGWTIGGAAWRELKRRWGIKPNALKPYEHRFVRSAYYGGRVQLLKHKRAPVLYQYDVNALYPSRLRLLEFPAGEPRWLFGRAAETALFDNCHGAYEVTVTVPPSYMPPLPIRYRKGGSFGIAYPTGTMRGVWMGVELVNAAHLGCVIDKVHRGLVWPETTREFAGAVDNWWRLRANAPGGKSSGLGEWLKFRSNSPCGKMGAREEKRRYELLVDDIRVCTCVTAEEKSHCRCQAHRKVSEYVFETTYSRIDECARIEIAATITAYGRVEVLDFALEAGVENVYYLDTDGVKLSRPPNAAAHKRLGGKMDLGKFLDEGLVYDFDGLAPKVYSGLSGAEGEGYLKKYLDKKAPDFESRVKNALAWKPRHFPPPEDEAVLLLTEEPVIKSKGGKLQERPREGSTAKRWGIRGIHAGAARGKFFHAVEMKRRFSRQYGDRIKLRGGETRAPRVDEIDIINPLHYVGL